MFGTIRTRLTISHLLVILIAMGMSGFLLLSFVEAYFLRLTEDNLVAQATITVQALAPTASLLQPPISNQMIQDMNQQSQNYVFQTPVDLSSNDVSLQTQLNTRVRILNVSEISDAEPLAARGVNSDRYVVQTSDDRMELAMPVRVNDRAVGVVILSQPLNDLTQVIRDLRQRWILSTLIAVLLSGGLGLILSQAITTPLRHLTHAAEAVAEGHFNRPVKARSRDELGRLSRTFNEMTRRLESARQMQTHFVANVSHELRTPLTAVKGMVETLREGAVDDLEVRDRFLETVETETNRLIRLVNDLLILSRADSEALSLRFKTVNLLPLVQAAIDQFACEHRQILLHTDVPEIHVRADSDRITQVLVNLLDNALKYSKGTVTVNIYQNQHALIQIRDEGIGIPAADLPYIGRRFYRTDKARSRLHGGSGLGLAIARALVEAHGGQFWLEST
ncbi:MAG: cell wall metabolism sensor histidine kinase WalK, partial [Anaerolineae bacterium]|nr:cell wall metabolism sensor histidine kinase WalK [Anaerolineae bacterium]